MFTWVDKLWEEERNSSHTMGVYLIIFQNNAKTTSINYYTKQKTSINYEFNGDALTV
jgi:hypothetical protein